MPVPKRLREKHEKIYAFKKEWGIKKDLFYINGMRFDIDWDVRDGKITGWISAEEGVPAEEILLFLMSVGLIPDKEKKIEVNWDA